MGTEVFIPQRMHAATLNVFEQANVVIAEYLAQGFALSLRLLRRKPRRRTAASCSRANWAKVENLLRRAS